jgi:hypothetical protein
MTLRPHAFLTHDITATPQRDFRTLHPVARRQLPVSRQCHWWLRPLDTVPLLFDHHRIRHHVPRAQTSQARRLRIVEQRSLDSSTLNSIYLIVGYFSVDFLILTPLRRLALRSTSRPPSSTSPAGDLLPP